MCEYYNSFVELSLQQCLKNDYADSEKIRRHNAASKKLLALQEEMKKNADEKVLYALLTHEDDRVKINAASFCLLLGLLIEPSVLTLKKLANDSDDSTICFSAKMLLSCSIFIIKVYFLSRQFCKYL